MTDLQGLLDLVRLGYGSQAYVSRNLATDALLEVVERLDRDELERLLVEAAVRIAFRQDQETSEWDLAPKDTQPAGDWPIRNCIVYLDDPEG